MKEQDYDEHGFEHKPIPGTDDKGRLWHMWSHKYYSSMDNLHLGNPLVIIAKSIKSDYEVWERTMNQGTRWFNNFSVISTHKSLDAAKVVVKMLVSTRSSNA
jgi:hypothetical protein